MANRKTPSDFLRDLIYPVLILLTKTRVKFKIHIENTPSLLSDKRSIFAVNHTNSFDMPISANAVYKKLRKHCVIIAGKQNLRIIDRLFFFLNGVIWVDRKNKNETSASKELLINSIRNGHDVFWFPEGTWNMTDNLLMLPMKWGIVDVAAATGSQIVPVVLEYDRPTMICRVSFGVPIAPDKDANKADAIRELRDAMSTLRWELWEKQEQLKCADVDCAALRVEIYCALEEYPLLDWDYEQTVFFKPHILPQDAFSHLADLQINRSNAFLFNKRLK